MAVTYFFFPSQTMAMAIIFIIFLIPLLFSAIDAEFQSFDQSSNKEDGSISLLVVGDWGRKGFYNQSIVAHQMGVIGEKLNVDFIVSTGDNFYGNGLTGEDDPAFEQSFTNIYTAPSLQKQWYAVLGNHDYRGNVLAQLSPVLREKDSKWLCLRSFIVNSEIVDFIFVDTTPFQDKYFSDPDHDYDWRGVLPREKYLTSVLKDLEMALKESTSKWKIVVGHHTIKSASIHGDTEELVHELLPILQANNVDLYINGHDHCLEHIASSDSSLQFVTSGGGSKAWRGVYKWKNDPNDVKFFYDGQGFISLEITKSEILMVFYDIDGYVLHKFSVIKSLHSAL